MTWFTYNYGEFPQVLLNLLAAGQLKTFCVLGNVGMFFSLFSFHFVSFQNLL